MTPTETFRRKVNPLALAAPQPRRLSIAFCLLGALAVEFLPALASSQGVGPQRVDPLLFDVPEQTSAQDCVTGATLTTFTGPIMITTGGTYTGNWQSADPATPAVQVVTKQPVTIINSRLQGPGDLLTGLSGVNVTVQESCFVGTYPTAAGTGKGHAIRLFQAANALIEHNDFEGVGGYFHDYPNAASGTISVQEYLGDGTLNNTIKIRYNRFQNLDGRFSDGLGGYLTTVTAQHSNGIQTLTIHGVPGIEVAWNQIINVPYQSGSGDSINIFDTSGTSDSPVQVHDNYIQGGWDSDLPNLDEFTYYGSAITTDGYYQTDPRLTTAFVKIHDNQAVGFGNLGFGIAAGHDIELYSNRVVSSGQLASGIPASASWGLGIGQANYRNSPAGVFGINSIHDNLSGRRRQRNGVWERLDYYLSPANVPPPITFNNLSWTPTTASAPIPSVEANEFTLWTCKLRAQGIRVGSHFVVPTASHPCAAPAGDFDGDGKTDVTVYRPSNGTWYILTSKSGLTGGAAYAWGVGTDVPVPGDYDGDGKADVAVYRPSSAHWFILQSSTNYTTSATYQWGTSGDLPVPGDYDGDGKTDLAIYRPANGTWYILTSSTGFSSGLGYAWGLSTDLPLPGDYDGDGRTDIVVYRPSSGHWFILQSSSNYVTSATYQWGTSGDLAVPGDYDGDGMTDLAIYRPSNGTWYIFTSSSGFTSGVAYAWGAGADVPVPGDYDGDGRADIAVYRPSTAYWFVLKSSTNYTTWGTYQWGTTGDMPVL